jgi:hypothetical protein
MIAGNASHPGGRLSQQRGCSVTNHFSKDIAATKTAFVIAPAAAGTGRGGVSETIAGGRLLGFEADRVRKPFSMAPGKRGWFTTSLRVSSQAIIYSQAVHGRILKSFLFAVSLGILSRVRL